MAYVWILRSGALLFANPADGGVGFANSRIQGTVRKSTDMGKTWQQSALHITPLGLSAARGGSYDYRCVGVGVGGGRGVVGQLGGGGSNDA